MQRYIASFLLVLVGHTVSAQTTGDFKKDMYGIASDATEGRFTGSPGYLKAARYVVGALKAAGLKPGWIENGKETYLQPVPFLWDDYDRSSLSVGGVVYHHSAGTFMVIQPGSSSTGKWVVLSSEDSIPSHVAGVVLLPGADQAKDWETTVIRQYRFGYMHYVPDGIPPQTGVPTIVVSPALAAHLSRGDSVTVTINRNIRKTTAYNVVALAPGADGALKNTAIIVGAHLDHIGHIGARIYNGANDDASGCVAGLETAKVIAANPCKRTVMFVFYCGEELNLKGSRWFTDHLPLAAGNILVHINLEQLGSKHRSVPGVWALGDPVFRSAFYAAGSMFSSNSLNFSPTDSVREALSNTDSYSFMNKNIPSLLLGSGGFDEHHTPQDKIALIDFPHLQKATRLLGHLVSLLGNEPAPRAIQPL
jgi:hypothetical protein